MLELQIKCHLFPDTVYVPMFLDMCMCFCEFPECRHSEFQCHNGECINGSLQCDSIDDCLDKSDETTCGGKEFTVVKFMFYALCGNVEYGAFYCVGWHKGKHKGWTLTTVLLT